VLECVLLAFLFINSDTILGGLLSLIILLFVLSLESAKLLVGIHMFVIIKNGEIVGPKLFEKNP